MNKFMTGINAKRVVNLFLMNQNSEYLTMEKTWLIADAFKIIAGIDKATIEYEIIITDDPNIHSCKNLELRGHIYTDNPITEYSASCPGCVYGGAE